MGARTALTKGAYALGFTALLVATFSSYVTGELGHDEGMYLGASYLAIDHELYSDVGYFQAPNLPLLLSTLFAWGGVTDYLLWGRIITFAHHAVILASLTTIAWHYTRNLTVTFLFTLWMGLNGFLFGAGYSIDNTTFASAHLFVAFFLGVIASERAWPMAPIFFTGALSAIAAGFKLNYAPLFACFGVAIAVFAPRRSFGVFLVGAVVGAAPSLYMLIDRPETFWFDNVTWHRVLLETNIDELGTGAIVSGFLSDAWHYVSRLSWLATIVVLVPIALAMSARTWRFDRVLLILVVVVGAITVVGLGAVRFWYLQPLAIASALLVPSVFSELARSRQKVLLWLLIAGVGAGLWSQGAALLQAGRVLDVGNWVPLRYARLGESLGAVPSVAAVGAIGNPAIVYGVEGELPLVPSAATGAFVRVSSPMIMTGNGRIATYESLSVELDMILATVDYVAPRSAIEPSRWCTDRPDELIGRWCDAGLERRVVGDGPSRVVAFYRDD